MFKTENIRLHLVVSYVYALMLAFKTAKQSTNSFTHLKMCWVEGYKKRAWILDGKECVGERERDRERERERALTWNVFGSSMVCSYSCFMVKSKYFHTPSFYYFRPIPSSPVPMLFMYGRKLFGSVWRVCLRGSTIFNTTIILYCYFI